MKKAEKILRKSVVLTIGKMLTLCGVALTFAACYAPGPEPGPDYWDNTPDVAEQLYGKTEKKQQPAETEENVPEEASEQQPD